MSNKIPPYSETFEKLRSAGYSKDEIESAVTKVSKEIGEFVPNKDYHIFIVAKNLGVNLGDVRFISSIRPYKINEITNELYQIEMRVYVVLVEKRKTSKGSDSIRLTVADETGTSVIRVFGDGIEKFENLKRGDYIHISPVRVEEYPKDSGKINLTAFSGCTLKVIEPDIPIEDFVPSVEKAKEGQLVHVRGVVLEQKSRRSWFGCSVCKKSLGDNEVEGEEVICPFCGNKSVVTKFVSDSIAVVSGDDTVVCELSPFISAGELYGSVVDIWGRYSEQWNRVDVISIDVIKTDILQPVDSYIDKDKKETKETKKKSTIKKNEKKVASETKKEEDECEEEWVKEMISNIKYFDGLLKKSIVSAISGKFKIDPDVVEKKIQELCDKEVLRERDGYVSLF